LETDYGFSAQPRTQVQSGSATVRAWNQNLGCSQ